MTDTKKAAKGLHIGFILDGNRRWAKENGLPQLQGHKVGYDNLKTIAEAAFDRGVAYVSAFVFSTENWNRAKTEVSYLMRLSHKMITNDYREANEKGIKILWMGSEEQVSKKLAQEMKKTVEMTKNNTKGTLALCFNYGGHREISEAFKKMIQQGITAEDISEAKIAENLYNPDVPPVDLIIRTSGEQRLSNFMLWRAAYSELYFSDKNWPDFSTIDLDEALKEYENRKRRFGR
jgi:undecaprenyl diphosphate synthase